MIRSKYRHCEENNRVLYLFGLLDVHWVDVSFLVKSYWKQFSHSGHLASFAVSSNDTYGCTPCQRVVMYVTTPHGGAVLQLRGRPSIMHARFPKVLTTQPLYCLHVYRPMLNVDQGLCTQVVLIC